MGDFERLISEARRLLAAGDYGGAREQAGEARRIGERDEEFAEADALLAEIADRETQDFLAVPVVSAPPSLDTACVESVAVPVAQESQGESMQPEPRPEPLAEAREDSPVEPAPVVAKAASAAEPVPVAPASISTGSPSLVAFVRQRSSGVGEAEAASKPSLRVKCDDEEIDDDDEDGEQEEKREAARVRRGARKESPGGRRRLLKPEVLIIAGGLGVLCLILKPWHWISSNSARMTAAAVDPYPDVAFKTLRMEPTTVDAVRAKFSEERQSPKPEFVARPAPVRAAVVPETPPAPTAEAPVAAPKRVSVSSARPARRATPVLASAPLSVQSAPELATAAAVEAPAETPPPRRQGGRFFDVAPAPGAPPAGHETKSTSSAGLPVSTRIKVALGLGISSTKPDVTVLAEVISPVKVDDRVVIPAGAIMMGTSSSDRERVYVRFHQVVVGGRKLSLGAAAAEGDMPGIKAIKREATLEERQQSRLAQGALGAAAGLAEALVGPAGSTLRELSDGAVRETQRAQEVDSSVVLIVPAKTQFEAIVTE